MYCNNIITKYRSIKKIKVQRLLSTSFLLCISARGVLARKHVLRHIFGNMLRQKKHVQRFSKGVSKM